jgi:acetylornithine deacetylase/succinyl-diaminopimelate desuccinylase-like protein
MCVANVAPTAMIFVPSIGGRSHVGDERTAPADLELGVEALAATLLAAAAGEIGSTGAGGATDR